MSFYTSLSGLKSAQTDLSVISNNVANVSSTGFKKSRADFGDLVSSSALQSGSTAGQGSRLKSITQQFGQGGFASSERALDMAISGQGFFVTSADINGNGASYTRNGAFGVDSDRFVKDSSGNYLQVLPVDQRTGGITETGLDAMQSLQVPLTNGISKATTSLNLTVNLPDSADLPSERAVYTAPATYAFDRYDPNSYNYSAQTTVYDDAGNAQPATIYYTRQERPTETNGVRSGNSVWEARLFVGDKESSIADAQGVPTVPVQPLSLTFDASGALTGPTAAQTFSTVTPSGSSSPFKLQIGYAATSAVSNSAFNLSKVTQDGNGVGDLSNVTVGNNGLVTATYSDGSSVKLGKVVVANFSNPAGLRQMGDASWGASGASGEPVIGEAAAGGNGSIQSGALELSNVDVTEELVALIAAQRNFQANAKAIETANTLTQTIIQTN